MLKRKIDTSSDFDMVVRRSHVLRDALRRMDKASFDPRKKLNVRIAALSTHIVAAYMYMYNKAILKLSYVYAYLVIFCIK